jgi:hypothetical protein
MTFPLLQLPNTYRAFYGAFAQLRPFQHEVIQPILHGRDVILQAATGFGLYQLFNSQSGAFPAFFDWVIVDEASQMLLPQALLSLNYGKGHYIFCGDVQQLPPVVSGPPLAEEEAMPSRSILAHLLATYGPNVRVRLAVAVGCTPSSCWASSSSGACGWSRTSAARSSS